MKAKMKVVSAMTVVHAVTDLFDMDLKPVVMQRWNGEWRHSSGESVGTEAHEALEAAYQEFKDNER